MVPCDLSTTAYIPKNYVGIQIRYTLSCSFITSTFEMVSCRLSCCLYLSPQHLDWPWDLYLCKGLGHRDKTHKEEPCPLAAIAALLLLMVMVMVMVPCDLSTTCLYMVLILCVFSHIPRSLFNACNELPQFDRSNHDVEHTTFATIGCNILRKRYYGKY